MPYSGTAAITFAQRQSGRYRDGECWTLVEDAVIGAGGKSSTVLTPNFGPNMAYIWGTAVQATALQPGDVLQFQNYRWTQTTRVDVSSPDGTSFSENDATQGRGAPHHSALVVRVVSPGVVEVIEQNIPPRSGGVQSLQLVLTAPPVSSTTVTSGSTVTVTTVTHVVSGIVRCYRPIDA